MAKSQTTTLSTDKPPHPWWQRAGLVRGIMLVVLGTLIAVIVAGYYFGWPWAGLTAYIDPKGDYHPDKTLWDWLSLLFVPVVIGGAAYTFRRSEQEFERQRAEQRVQAEQALAEDAQRETALQSYIDRMTQLLLANGLRASDEDAEVRVVARTLTLTVLPRLDPRRKRAIMQFLHEGNLISTPEITTPVVQLSQANLSEANLSGANLSEANLSGANLSGANLSGANLSEANLSGANLSGANLLGANLEGADLKRADLEGAILFGAILSGADLKRADLEGAYLFGAILFGADLKRADLKDANLEGAILKGANLEGANLEGAILFGAYLEGANLEGANLEGAILTDIQYDDATRWPAGFTPPPSRHTPQKDTTE